MTSAIKTINFNRNQLQNPVLQKLQTWRKSLRALVRGMDTTLNEYLKVSQKFWYTHAK